MIRHCVLFTFKPGTSDEHIAGLEAGLARLGMSLPGIVAYRFGRDAGINQGNHQFAVVADFRTRDDYIRYRDDAGHQQLIAEFIAPAVESRAAVQFEVP